MTKTKFLPVLAALALLGAACGSSGDDTPAGVKATGAPIVFGVQAPTKGVAAYPQSGYGVKAAEWYVNNVLGGVNGRPIKADICAGDGSPETAINCANGFVSADVPFVLDAFDQAMSGAVPILSSAGIPIVGTVPGSPVPNEAEYGKAFYFSGPIQASALGSMSILSDLGKKKLALAIDEGPTAHAYIDTMAKPIASRLGMRLEAHYVPGASANFNVIAATQLAGKPDAAGVVTLPEDSCTSLFQALRQQGYQGTIFAGSCSQFIDMMGAQAAGAITQPRLWVPLSRDHAPKEVADQLDAFAEAMKQVGYEKEQSARSLYSFAGVINMVNVMKTMKGPAINAKAITTAMKGLKDFKTFAGPAVTCDGKAWPTLPAGCSRSAIFFEVRKDGTLAPVKQGGYTELDPSVLPAS